MSPPGTGDPAPPSIGVIACCLAAICLAWMDVLYEGGSEFGNGEADIIIGDIGDMGIGVPGWEFTLCWIDWA
jgi:hypothetical protein